MNNKSRWFTSIVAALLFITACVFLSSALARQRRVSSTPDTGIRTATINAVTGFTFSAPLELTGHPPSPVFFQQDAEPEIKIDIFGNIYVTAIQGVPGGVDFWKSTDKGTTFVYLGQPDGAQDHCSSPTPQCLAAGGGDDQIDVSPGGYLYISSLWAGNVTMSTSMDGGTGGTIPGQAWQVQPAASNVPVDDRQWVAAYGPQTLYMTMRQAPGTGRLFLFKSTDAGNTFAPTTADPLTPLSASVSREGNLVVDQYNGNIYTTFTSIASPSLTPNRISLLSSTDGGNTFTTTVIYTGPNGTSVNNAFPNLALDRGGNLHLAFAQSNGVSTTRTSCHVFLMSTANPAAAAPTWTLPVQVDSGPLNNTALMPWIVAGSPGVVDVTWLGSTVSSPDVTPNPDVTKGEWWQVSFGQVTNALSATPTIAQTIVAANVHNLSICSSGGACPAPTNATDTRKLLEYYTMTIDPDGNANIAFPDSVDNCPSTTCFTNTWYVTQTGGPIAFSPPTPPSPATFATNLNPINTPGSAPGAEPNMKADSHNCLFSASPGTPSAWKSSNAGASFDALPNPVADETGIIGGDEDIFPLRLQSGARPDQLYFADLGVSTVHIRKSNDGGATWRTPGAANTGEVSASVDRQWLSGDRDDSGANQTVYLWEHEFTTQALRMSALTNDTAWSPFASGITAPELIAPPGSTLSNTNPGPMFVDRATHNVFGFFNASTVTSNTIGAPAGKLPNVWEADGAGTFTSPIPPGPFTNHPVFKGVFDSATTPAPPAGTTTFGSNTGNLFCGAAIDSAGNIYVTWATPNARNNKYQLWFASSHDHGQTYYGPFLISSSGFTQATSPWIAAGDNGRVDIVFYGTTGTEPPNTSTTDIWNVFFAQSLNANDREPVFTVSQASDHVMHVGPICNVGILCGSGTRQLLDFFQVAIGPDGLANVAYADDGASNGSAHVSYARQNSGPLALTSPTFPVCLGNVVPLTSVVSRMTHGSAGTFDVNLPLIGTRGVECRSSSSLGAGNYTLVFTFPNNLRSVGGVTVTGHDPAGGTGSVSSTAMGPSANQYTVNLTNVSDAQYITVTLNSVVDSTGNAANVVGPQMGVLIGDTTANGLVNSSDVAQTQSQSGQVVTASNFREDVTVNGAINSSDIALVQSKSGTGLPSSP